MLKLGVIFVCIVGNIGAFRVPFANFNLGGLQGIPFPFTGFTPWGNVQQQQQQQRNDLNQQEQELSFGMPSFGDVDSFDSPSTWKVNWDMPKPPQPNAKDLKSKNRTYEKDGFKIREISKSGPGWTTYVSEATKVVGDNVTQSGNGTEKLKNFMKMLRGGGERVHKKCKKCPSNKYCSPITGKCHAQRKQGEVCALAKQCTKPLVCVWGKCNNAALGEPGTFCNSSEFCHGEARCAPFNEYHRTCTTLLGEGAVCGENNALDLRTLMDDASKDAGDNVCKRGLKCAQIGDPTTKRCVKLDYMEDVEQPDKTVAQAQAEQDNPEVIEKVQQKQVGSGDEDESGLKQAMSNNQAVPDQSDQPPNQPGATKIEEPKKNKKPNKQKGRKNKDSQE